MQVEKTIVSNTIESVTSFIEQDSFNFAPKSSTTDGWVGNIKNVWKKGSQTKRPISIIRFRQFLKKLTSNFDITRIAYSNGKEKIYFWIELPEDNNLINENGIIKHIDAFNKTNSIFQIEELIVYDDMNFEFPDSYKLIIL